MRHIPVIVRWDGVGHPSGIGVGVNDANGWDVVQCALVKQDIVLQRVEANNEIRPQHRAVVQLLFETWHLLVQLINHLHAALAQDLLSVCDASWDPALEQMVALCELGCSCNCPVLSVASAYEQDHASAPAHLLHDLGGSSQVGGSGLERDDVDALPDAVDVARIGGIPQGGDMALVGFGGEEQLEGDFSR